MGVLMINDEPVGTTPDAKHTPFNPSGTDLTATNVEDAIKEVNESDTDANDVIYDNSNTGLPANVQGALDKTTGNISSLDTVELTATAAHAHAAGSTFLWIGQLVKVTTAIAVGDTIAHGTNVANTDICSVLAELNSKTTNIIVNMTNVQANDNHLSIRKINNTVIVNGYCKVNIPTANQYVILGKIVGSCIPLVTIRIPCVITNEPWNPPKEMGLLIVENVDNEAYFSIRSVSLTGAQTIYFNVTYICQ